MLPVGGTREDLSPKHFEAAKTSQSLDFQEDNTGAAKINPADKEEGNAPMLSEEETPKKFKGTNFTKKKLAYRRQARLDSLQTDEEVRKSYGCSHSTKNYRRRRGDLRNRRKEKLKYMLGSELQGEDFAKRMVDIVNQRKKLFAEERAKAKRNKPMTQSQLKTYMIVDAMIWVWMGPEDKLENGFWKCLEIMFEEPLAQILYGVEIGNEYSLKDKKQSQKGQNQARDWKSTTNLKNDITNFQQRFDETFSEAWDRFKDLHRKCLHHGFSELHQIDTFYNALTQSDQDYINAAVGDNLLNRTPRDALTIIKNKSKFRTPRNKPIVSKMSATTSSSTPVIYRRLPLLLMLLKLCFFKTRPLHQLPLKL
ncbi:reverse transcriptase domain-containing protein [Tanacetum coccineum]